MIKKIYFDTNIIIDLFDKKRTSHLDSLKLFQMIALDENIDLYINTDSVTNLFYILRSRVKMPFDEALAKLEFIKDIFEIVSIDKEKISFAIEICTQNMFDDYEDAVQYICALDEECETIVTNNIKDFKKCDIKISTSKEYNIDE